MRPIIVKVMIRERYRRRDCRKRLVALGKGGGGEGG